MYTLTHCTTLLGNNIREKIYNYTRFYFESMSQYGGVPYHLKRKKQTYWSYITKRYKEPGTEGTYMQY